MDFGFNKQEKLCNKFLFEEVIKSRKSAKAYPLRLGYVKAELNENVLAQVAFAVPKRKFKKAIDRNRIKRLMRESYRLNKHLLASAQLSGYAFLFIYLDNKIPTYQTVFERTQSLLLKFIEKESTNTLE